MEGSEKLPVPRSIVLCLSGGGLRATFFHLGLVRALRELNLLQKVTDVVSVSGGSIFAAHLVQHWEEYVGNPSHFDTAQDNLLSLRQWDLRGNAIRRSLLWWPLYYLSLRFPKRLGRFQIGRSDLLRQEFDKFFKSQIFDELNKSAPGSPQLHLVSTNLQTGSLCAFTKTDYECVEDGQLNGYSAELTKVSFAVTASAAFPPVFPPILFDESMTGGKSGTFHISPHVLTDGGVYDNTGYASATVLEEDRKKKTGELSDLILVSDAGSPFQWLRDSKFMNPIALAFRAAEVIMNRVWEEVLRKIASDKRVDLISIEKTENEGAIHLSKTIQNAIDRIDPKNMLTPQIQAHIARIRTDMDRFSDLEVVVLVKHAEKKATRQLLQRLNIDPEATPAVMKVNEFPILLPSSLEVLDRVLKRSRRVRWWNTFTNFSDWRTYIIDLFLFASLSTVLWSIFLVIGGAYLEFIAPFRGAVVASEAVSPVQAAPSIRPLPPLQTGAAPEIQIPAVNPAQVSRCLGTIDRDKLSFDQVTSAARQCLQSR
jgi:predicted acylesterase/phospholipase RssA